MTTRRLRGHRAPRRQPWGATSSSIGLGWILAATMSIVTVGCSDGPEEEADTRRSDEPFFTEMAARAGIDFVHRNGATGRFYYPELMQGGGAFVDFDNDSLLDIYLVQSGPLPAEGSAEAENRLLRNRGDGTFEDVTDGSGAGDRGYGSGIAVGDYDGDGWIDLYITNLGANALLRNRGAEQIGRVTFEDVTVRAGVGDPGYSTSAAFVDYDRDGDLDLFVCNYLDWSPRIERRCLGYNGQRGYCSPLEYDAPQSDTLYRNNGTGPDGTVTFTDVSGSSGIRAVRATGLGVVTADFDGDGLVDIYVANDQMPNHLWLNNGRDANGRVSFREEALIRGSALNEQGRAEAGMGVATADPDNDGDWDLFMVHVSSETNTYYSNEDGDFRDRTDEVGLGAVSQPLTGFGTGFADLDHDGFLDLFVANGKVRLGDTVEFDYREPNLLLLGTADGTFVDASADAGEALQLLEVSRATSFGDYDNDGDIDLLLVNNGGPARLLRNERGFQGHWLNVRPIRGDSGGDVFGAVVEVKTGGRTLRRIAQPAYGYCASNDPRAHFGLGDVDLVESVRVIWPDGSATVRENVATDRFLEIESSTEAQPTPGGSG